jgi:two-component system, cell cycle sensor histidine kinase and response regulator CckA
MLVARPLNVNEVIQDLRSLWDSSGRKLTVTTSFAENLPAVRMDRARLEETLISIVANADEAMGEGGQVAIATDLVAVNDAMREGRPWLTGGTWVRVRISDRGPGVAQDVLARVFEPFFTTKRPGEGSGLGLSTAYGIVKQSGGFVWMESAPGQGASVVILLPPAAAEEASAAPVAAPVPVRPHVLLVEDQDAVRDMLATMLKKQGYEVSAAASAEDALAMSPQRPVDLLLTDVVLPGMTGPDLARRLRQATPDIRVLFMSGYTGDALTDQDELGDERSFIQKPFQSQALFDRIRSLLNAPTKGVSTLSGQP